MENVGILDPEGKNKNPLTNEDYSDQYRELAQKWRTFPAYEKARDIIDAVKNNQVILITAGTGSGKTVLAPKFVLHSFDYKGKIAITLPKQIISKSAAEFSSRTLDVKLGEEVGYQYKGSDSTGKSAKTLLLYATDGTIVARLLKDPELKDFDAVIVDEAHERKVQIDFLLYLLRNVLNARPNFKIVIMSATVNEEIFRMYFGEYKFISFNIGGKTNYPIESIFLSKPLQQKGYIEAGYEKIKEILKKDDPEKNGAHDILFFVTSINETFEICEKVRELDNKVYCIEVFAGMDMEKQTLAQDRNMYKSLGHNRKVVIATNVAESSLTIDGIKFVIDSGYELFGYYDPDRRSKVLKRKLITNAQVKQRMGRSGRTEPGVCYHLYTKDDFENKMEKYPEPNIRVSNIYAECLRLLDVPSIENIAGLKYVLSKFIEPPKNNYIDSAITQLVQLGLIEDDKINSLGSIISDMQIDPEEGLAIYASYKMNCVREVSAIMAMIDASKNSLTEMFTLPMDMADDEPDKLKYLMGKFKTAKKKSMHKYGDHLSILKIFTKYMRLTKSKSESNLRDWLYEGFLKRSTLEKGMRYFKKTYHRTLRILNGQKKYDQDILEYDLEYRIMASIYFGFRNNIGYYKAGKTDKDGFYNTNFAKKVQIHKESFMHFHEKPKKIVVYHELFTGERQTDMNIVSSIPQKSEELFNKIRDILK